MREVCLYQLSSFTSGLLFYTGAEHPKDVAADVLNAALMDRPEP